MLSSFLNMLETEQIMNKSEVLILSELITLSIILIGFIIKAIAIFIMAKNQGLKNKWFAFVPFLNYVLLGKIVGPIRIFNVRLNNAGLWMAIITFSSEVLYFLLNLGYYKYVLETIYPISINVSSDFGLAWMQGEGVLYFIAKMIVSLLNIAEIFVSVSLIFAVFKKYAPERMFLYGIISVFFEFFFGVLLLMVANKKPVDYDSYIRKIREQQARNTYYGGGFNAYQNPYYKKPEQEENPFPEFSDTQNNENKDKSNDDFFN